MESTKLLAMALLALTPVMAQTYSTPMRDVDNPARVPVKFNVSVGGDASLAGAGGSAGAGDNSTIVVPAGRRLVIDEITLRASVPVGSSVVYASISNRVGTEHNSHQFALQKQGTMVTGFTTNGDVFMAAYQTTLVADPGTTVGISFGVDNVGSLSSPSQTTIGLSVEISGHYVVLP